MLVYHLKKISHHFLLKDEIILDFLSGRFDDTVIEERRISAVAFLNFVATQPHLYKSLLFRQFLDVSNSYGMFISCAFLEDKIGSRQSIFEFRISPLNINIMGNSSKMCVDRNFPIGQ